MDIELGLGTDAGEHHSGWHQQNDLVTNRDGTSPDKESRQEHCSQQPPDSTWDFDKQTVEVIVLPASVSPFPAQVGFLTEVFEVLLLAVEAQHILSRQREWH